MGDSVKLSITVEQGNAIFNIASFFQMPEKLGEKTYNVADRALANDEVGRLMRLFRAYSPLSQTRERRVVFGPAEVWDEIRGDKDGGIQGYRLLFPEHEVSLSISEDEISGAMWCLLLGLHPASPVCHAVSRQQDALWPLAARLSRVSVLKEEIGIGKASPRRWKEDAPEKTADSVPEKK
jgi:hypothetical protein